MQPLVLYTAYMIKLEFYRKSVYGQELIYLNDPNQADFIRVLTKQKTLTRFQLKVLAALGFEPVEVLAPTPFRTDEWTGKYVTINSDEERNKNSAYRPALG